MDYNSAEVDEEDSVCAALQNEDGVCIDPTGVR